MAIGKKKKVAPSIGKPRDLAPPQPITGRKRAHRLHVAIGLDVDNQSHLLGKGPEQNFMQLREIGRALILNNGQTTVDGRDIQLTSAAIMRPGERPPKRYTFRPAKATPKKKTTKKAAPITSE